MYTFAHAQSNITADVTELSGASDVTSQLILQRFSGNFARDFRPDPPAWVNHTNNFLNVDQLLTACLQDNNSLIHCRGPPYLGGLVAGG